MKLLNKRQKVKQIRVIGRNRLHYTPVIQDGSGFFNLGKLFSAGIKSIGQNLFKSGAKDAFMNAGKSLVSNLASTAKDTAIQFAKDKGQELLQNLASNPSDPLGALRTTASSISTDGQESIRKMLEDAKTKAVATAKDVVGIDLLTPQATAVLGNLLHGQGLKGRKRKAVKRQLGMGVKLI